MEEDFTVVEPMGAKEVIAGWNEVNNPLRFFLNRRAKSATLMCKIAIGQGYDSQGLIGIIIKGHYHGNYHNSYELSTTWYEIGNWDPFLLEHMDSEMICEFPHSVLEEIHYSRGEFCVEFKHMQGRHRISISESRIHVIYENDECSYKQLPMYFDEIIRPLETEIQTTVNPNSLFQFRIKKLPASAVLVYKAVGIKGSDSHGAIMVTTAKTINTQQPTIQSMSTIYDKMKTEYHQIGEWNQPVSVPPSFAIKNSLISYQMMEKLETSIIIPRDLLQKDMIGILFQYLNGPNNLALIDLELWVSYRAFQNDDLRPFLITPLGCKRGFTGTQHENNIYDFFIPNKPYFAKLYMKAGGHGGSDSRGYMGVDIKELMNRYIKFCSQDASGNTKSTVIGSWRGVPRVPETIDIRFGKCPENIPVNSIEIPGQLLTGVRRFSIEFQFSGGAHPLVIFEIFVILFGAPWSVERLLWIGHMKNSSAMCPFAKLPRDLIKEILKFSFR